MAGYKLAGQLASCNLAAQSSVGRSLAPAVRSSVDHSSAPDRSSVGRNFGMGRKSAGHKASG